MRKRYIGIVGLVLLSMILAACTTPTATPVTTEQPVVPTAITTEAPPPVVTEAPTTAPTAAPTEAAAPNPYIGSGKLDGNGVPPDFFNDVHIRKAFAYCFDWNTLINEVDQGEAVQPFTLALPGMPGYDANAPHYSFDLTKCADEFKAADLNHNGVPAGNDTGDVWDMGFRIQMLYNTGNTLRQTIAEIEAADLAEVNEKFVVETLGLPWPSYLAAQRAHRIPVMTAGWLEDIHDPSNWYQPYTIGTYAGRSGLPDDLTAQFKTLLDQGVSVTDPAARDVIYKQINQLYYDQVAGVPLDVQTSHFYEQKWVEGRIPNPIFSGVIYRTLSKADGAKNPTTLTHMTIGEPETLDPALDYETAGGNIVSNVYDSLVYYDGEAPGKFVAGLASDWKLSDDGKTWTFTIRPNVTFHNGDPMTPSDVAYSFQRGILQGGSASPQWLLSEPFLGVGNQDITNIVDQGASMDDKEALLKNDPAVLKAACEKVTSAIVADDTAGTVTFNLAQPWGPFLATIANNWGAIMDKKWVAENGGWDGSCDTWQNFYAFTPADDPFTAIMNGTGAYKFDHWTTGQEIVLTKNENYWGEPAKLDRVVVQLVPEFGTRFAALQAGDADIITVNADQRPQVDPLVGVIRVYDPTTETFGPDQNVCAVDVQKLGIDRFTICETPSDKPLRLYFGQPGIVQQVMLFNWGIK